MNKRIFASLVLGFGATLATLVAVAMPPGGWAVLVLGSAAALFVVVLVIIILVAGHARQKTRYHAELRRAELAAQEHAAQLNMMREQAYLQRQTLGLLGAVVQSAGEREAARDSYYHAERQSANQTWMSLVQSGQAVNWLLNTGYQIAQDEYGLYLIAPDGQSTYNATDFDGLDEADLARALSCPRRPAKSLPPARHSRVVRTGRPGRR